MPASKRLVRQPNKTKTEAKTDAAMLNSQGGYIKKRTACF